MTMDAGDGFSMLDWSWLPALYAHPSRWGVLATARPARPARGQRIVLRVSAALIEAEGLGTRSAPDAPRWLRLAPAPFMALAERLGQLMLAERLRQALDRRTVLSAIELLGAAAREQAYDDARHWPGLAAVVDPAEPMPADHEALAALGGGVLAALLESGRSGQRERLLLRFAAGAVTPRRLAEPARADAARFLAAQGVA
jgi:hypothetical protein